MRIVKLSAAILAALFLSATAAAATITQEGSGIGKDGEIKVVFEDGKIKNVDILKQQENPVLSQTKSLRLTPQSLMSLPVQSTLLSAVLPVSRLHKLLRLLSNKT